ncbi:MAG: zinc-dependent metalloprotease [Chitinophagaceae bacterium]|nr:zinc-dependent metalloprotease [Chitinophagaceae bacterium]
MRKLSLMAAVLIAAATLFNSCKKSTKTDPASVSQEILSQIKALGFSTNGATPHEDGYLVEGDIFLSKENLSGLEQSHNLIYANEEHYRTTNLVSTSGGTRTITVSLNTSQANFISATDEAIRRYNALNLTVRFQRVAGTSANINIVTFYQVSNTLGSAGFPTGGNPFNRIQMNTYWYTPSIAVNALATTIAHEMGHCIGFRHTDYMNRAYSCGTGGNEGASTVGAVYIPGTPTGPSAGSWMLACGSTASNFNRPFTTADQTALNYVY